MPYASLADAAKAAGRFYGVDDRITEYITSMIQDFTQIEVFLAYNQLGNKMYEHHNQTVDCSRHPRTQGEQSWHHVIL